MFVWKNYAVPTIMVYPKYKKNIEVPTTGEVREVKSSTITHRNKKFVIENGHLYYEPHREFLEEFLASTDPYSYSVEILSSRVRYVIDNMKIELTKKKVTVNGIEVDSVEKALSITPFLKGCASDAILAFCKKPDIYGGTVTIEAAEQYFAIPRKHKFSEKIYMRGYVEIKNPKGKASIPYIPVFIRRYKIIDIHYTVKHYQNKMNDPVKPFIIPGTHTRTKYGFYYYERPDYWHGQLEDGAYVAREGREWVIMRKDKRGFADAVFHTNRGDYYVYPVLPAGQKVLFMRYSKDVSRVYGIVTPEGVFVLDVPTKRLYKNEPISALEKDVTIVGTFIIFPVPVKMSKSAIHLDTYLETFTITIDDYTLVENFEVKTLTPSTGKKIFDEAKIPKDSYDIIMHYGLSAL